ncbi:unknown [Anaerotruncus sp. CAG:390]|nr:unknown [Anaerotruncus sp. CAG:390]
MDRMTRDGSITFADRTTPMLFLLEGARGCFLLHRIYSISN